jgi:AraC-like DNA-binding protein
LRRETGYSFSAWRQRLRLLRSLELLAEGVPVSHIALDLGWASPSAFIQLFKREFGDTPGIYRARLGS